MANQDNWWEFPDGNPSNPNDNTGWTASDPYDPAPQPPGGGAGSPCGPGTFEIDIDASGNPKGGPDGECVDQAEASRRNKLWIAKNPGNKGESKTPSFADASPFPSGAPKYNFAKAPTFTAPEFKWNETFQAPDYNSLASDPGFNFRKNQALGAMQSSAAAKGFLRTGATVKDLGNYASDYASQELNNLFNRNLSSYNTRFGTARDIFDRYYTGKKDEFTPKYGEWQTLTAAEQHAKDLAWQAAINKWYHDNLSAADIYGQGA